LATTIISFTVRLPKSNNTEKEPELLSEEVLFFEGKRRLASQSLYWGDLQGAAVYWSEILSACRLGSAARDGTSGGISGVVVKVGDGVPVGVSVGVSVPVGVLVGVWVGCGVAVGVEVSVGVAVGVGVSVGVAVGV
jgi:hypothetical protein